MNFQVALTAFIEYDALSFQQQPLQLGLVEQESSGRNAAARVDDSMPGYRSAVIRSCVHGPANEARAITVLQQSSDLSVSHNTASRNF